MDSSGAWDGSATGDSNNDAELLKRVWRTEKAAPEILQFEARLVQRSREQIQLVVSLSLSLSPRLFESHVTKCKKQPNVDLSCTEAEYAAATMATQECVRLKRLLNWLHGFLEDLLESGSDALIVSLNQMDMDRTLYLLRSYLRTRLQKIEKYMFHIHKNTELWNRLSEQEQKFAQRCIEDLEDHFDKSVLSKLPDRYKSSVKQSVISEEDDMGNAFIFCKLMLFVHFVLVTSCFIFPFWPVTVPEPHLDTFVICRTKTSLGALQLDNRQSIIFFGGVEDPVDLDPGDLYAVRYKSIKPLVHSGRIELV
ncbi:hypothetical protein RHSIM_Rhsim05G0134600 [Rhododendron simsii]|uniref:DNA replication complex GINS protein SLD5 n=1 Tax=Rhododendron simsii TaxID=118357 RepID=A0A834LQ34_RHOSS|nr:hypothetical protein RHSIM_Rhsim05G0134600 [Rhododendron simsii]